jgi:hypothetical protein
MKKNKKAYSVIVALSLVWFLLVMVSWIYNLVLKELNDNRAMWNYLKSYFWAEAAAELALLEIKQKWYGIDSKIDHSKNNKSIILSDNPKDISKFKWNKEVYLSYDLNTKTNNYSWEINSLWYDIVPLFYLNWAIENKIKEIDFKITSWTSNDVIWNIVWQFKGISWLWDFNHSDNVDVRWYNSSLNLTSETIKNFLTTSSTNYLILFNSWNTNIKYTLKSQDSLEYFTKPKTNIIASAQVWNYRQNLNIFLDNTKYLDILKYSIYSN